MTLSKRQVEVLTKLEAQPYTVFGMRTTHKTVNSLYDKGYVVRIGVGHELFPNNCEWQITNAGRNALKRLL